MAFEKYIETGTKLLTIGSEYTKSKLLMYGFDPFFVMFIVVIAFFLILLIQTSMHRWFKVLFTLILVALIALLALKFLFA